MLSSNKDIQLPVVIRNGPRNNRGTFIYSPDLKLEVKGTDLVDAMSRAVQHFSAVYFYNLSKNVQIELSCTYEKACEHAKKDRRAFASFVPLKP